MNGRSFWVTYLLAFAILWLPFASKYGLNFSNKNFIDLPSFYYAAKASFVDGFSPYDHDKVIETYNTDSFPYLYPPPSLVLFYPLSLVDYAMAAKGMLLMSHICLVLSLVLMIRLFDLDVKNGLIYLFTIYLFSFQPLYLTLSLGQVNIILLFLICLFWYGLTRDTADWITAIPLALAIVLKTYPIIFLAFLFLINRKRVLYYVLGYLGITGVASFFILPDQTWSNWLTDVLPSGGFAKVPFKLFNPAAPWNQSINGFVSRLFFENPFSEVLVDSDFLTLVAGYSLTGIVLGASLYLIWRTRSLAVENVLNLQFGIVLIATYLIAPLSWEHHLVFLLPGILLIIKDVLAKNLGIISVLLISVLLVLAKDLPLESDHLKRGMAVFLISLKFYAVFSIWIYLLRQLYVRHREALIK